MTTTRQTTGGTVSYKGRTYRLLWTGPTKFGQRCKLGFMDGSKEFWVDAAAVSGAPASAGRPQSRTSNGLGRRTGCSCGSQEGGSKPTDCNSCRFDQDDM
jgi:hypothetical protein